MSFQKCPICNGVGQVSGGYFGRAGDYDRGIASDTIEVCKICRGWGIIDEITGLPPEYQTKGEGDGSSRYGNE